MGVGCADGVVRLEGVIESSTVAAGPSRSFWRAVSGESDEREGRPHELAVLVASTRSHSLEQSVHSSNRLYRSSPGAVPTERALAQAVHLASSSLVRNISRCETMFDDTEIVQGHKEEERATHIRHTAAERERRQQDDHRERDRERERERDEATHDVHVCDNVEEESARGLTGQERRERGREDAQREAISPMSCPPTALPVPSPSARARKVRQRHSFARSESTRRERETHTA